MRGTTKFELILFYNSGKLPEDATKLGYHKATAYKYFKYWKSATTKLKSLS